MKRLFIFFVFTSYSINAQVNKNLSIVDYKHSTVYGTNFYGPIKTVRWYYTYVADSLKMNKNRKDLQDHVMYYNRDIGRELFYEFDIHGKLKKTISRYSKFSDLRKYPLEEKYASYYNYSEEDLKSKSLLSNSKIPKYPTPNYYQSVKLNMKSLLNTYEGSNQNNWYQYKIDSKNKRITEEKHYSSISDEKETPTNKDLYTSIQYQYNNKGELVRQIIRPGEAGKRMSFYALGTESQFCTDLNISYTYEQKSRLKGLLFLGCEEELKRESYEYDSLKNFVSKVDIEFFTSLRNINYVTKKMSFFYDEYGNLLQKDLIQPDAEYVSFGERMLLPKSTYYKYEFDKYNNWNKCYIYMEGKDGPVTAIIEREIEYY